MARSTEKAVALDKHIGNRIREQRENLGLTQGELAEACNVSYQQIHKYEHGTNRISAGRLGLIASILQVSVQFFYDGFSVLMGNSESHFTEGRLCLEVARNFRMIADPRYQEALHFLVRTLAGGNRM